MVKLQYIFLVVLLTSIALSCNKTSVYNHEDQSSLDNPTSAKSNQHISFLEKLRLDRLGKQQSLFRIAGNSFWGYIDRYGAIVVKPQFKMVKEFSDGFGEVQDSKTEKWGYVNLKGTLVIKPQFDETGPFSEDLAAVKDESGFWGYIDKKGRVVIKPQFDAANQFSEGLALVGYLKAGRGSRSGRGGKDKDNTNDDDLTSLRLNKEYPYQRYGYIDKSGKFIINPRYYFADKFSEGLAAVYDEEIQRYGYINTFGILIIPYKFEYANSFSQGLAAIAIKDDVQNSQRWGYINKKGMYVIKPQYQKADSFSEGLASVEVYGKYGYIDLTGRYIINSKFIFAGTFKEGLALVGLDSIYEDAEDERSLPFFKLGYINKKGFIEIYPNYLDAKSFRNGLALVADHKGCCYIDKTGNIIWGPSLDLECNNLMVFHVKFVNKG